MELGGSEPVTAPVGIPMQATVQLLIAYQSSDQPLAYDFFNPATDLRRGESLASYPTNPGVPTERVSTNIGMGPDETVNPIREIAGLPGLSFPAATPLPSSSRPQTHFGATTVRELSPFPRAVGEHGRSLGVYADIG